MAAWLAAILVLPTSPESAFHRFGLSNLVFLLAWGMPPLATLVVATRRGVRLALAVGLAAASLVLGWLLSGLVLGLMFAIGCSGSPDPCLS